MDTCRITLDTPTFPHHLPFWMLADDQFQSHDDIEYEVVTSENYENPLNRIKGGESQLAVTRPLQLVETFLKEGNVTGLARFFHTKTGIVYRSTDLEEPDDLDDSNSIGYFSISEDTAKTLLKAMGIMENIELTSCTGDPIERFREGAIDAILPGSVIPDAMQLQLSQEDVDVWHFSDFGIPENGDLVLVASNDIVNDQPNEVQTVVHDLHDKVTSIQENSDPLSEFYKECYPGWDGSPVQQSLAQSTVPQFTEIFSQDFSTYQDWSEFLTEHVGIEGFLDLDTLLDERFLPIDAMSF